MKKIAGIMIVCIMFSSFTAASAISINHEVINLKNKSLLYYDDWSGEFSGNIGYKDPNSEEPKIVATISGNFKIGEKACFFNGVVTTENEGKSGSFKGLFNKHMLVGKIEGEKGSLKIVGFIGFKQEEHLFGGKFMSTVGPALYFWGDYLEY